MGKIINTLLGKDKEKAKQSTLKSIDVFTPFFSGQVDPKLNDTFMACCQAHARHGAKFAPTALRNGERDKITDSISTLLTLRPNPIMNAPTFWEKITENYFETNNVFLYLDFDYKNIYEPLRAIYPLDPDGNQVEVRKGDDGNIYIRFMMSGKIYFVNIDQIVHIARNVNSGEFFGYGNKAIEQTLKVIQTNYEGIEQAIKSSAFLRFIVQTTTMMNDDVLEQKAARFSKTYLSKNSMGVAYIDGATNIIQANSQGKYANADEMNFFEKKIYSYFGINEKILQATFNEDEWAAYYESSLEPLALKIETELTYKIFTKEERAKGYKIVVHTDRLQTASLKTRASIAAIIQKLPVYKPNTINELLFLPKTEHGEKEYIFLNYENVSKETENENEGEVKVDE